MTRLRTPLRRRRARRSDVGTTMAELLVSMGLLGVALPLAGGLLVAVSGLARSTLASSANVQDARLALAHVDRQVRSGNQPLTVSDTSLTLVTCDDVRAPADAGRPRVVEFRISGGALQERTYRPAVAPGDWGTLVSGLDAASGFAASGAGAVRVAVTVVGRDGRAASAETVVAPRNAALSTPLPETCP